MRSEKETHRPMSSGRLFRQRLWGAAVLIALAVIVLPLLLDGAGSESRFRELEAMREAPPVRLAGDERGSAATDNAAEPGLAAARPAVAAPSAWIVQAGSFRKEANAVSLRDRLRADGFASFVNQQAADDGVYRVNVGPMISRERAETTRGRVDELLGRESFIGKYP